MQSSLEVNIPFGDPSLIKVALLYFLVYLSAPSVCSLSFPTFILVFYTVTHNVRFGEWMSSFPFSVDKVKWNIIPCAEILLSWDKLITYESKKQKPTACDQASHHHLEPCRYLKLYHCASVWSLSNWNYLHSIFTSSTAKTDKDTNKTVSEIWPLMQLFVKGNTIKPCSCIEHHTTFGRFVHIKNWVMW